jgi:tetratricopeptide (TPR) repeat protein
VEETAALTLVTLEGELYRQGTARNGHLRWNEVAPMQYGIHVVAPGFDPAFQEIDAHGTSEVRVTVQLRPQTGRDRAYPPLSSDPEVNYVYGVYASRMGDWEAAKSFWAIVLQLRPDSVPAMVSISEALLNEDKDSEAMEYLDRAAKTDPFYWRTQAVLAEVYLRTGSTSEAVEHAKRAIEMGHGEAASVFPLLARALAAEATEVLRAYLKDHPADVAAKKQFESLSTAAGERGTATTAAKPASPPRDSAWLPPEVDKNVPPIEPGSACNLEEVLHNAGQRIQEFVRNVERFTASESLLHETISKSGKVSGREERKYDYMVSIEEIRPGILGVEEYLSSGSAPADPLGGITSKGLPALVLIFHSYYSGNFSMRCEGLATLNGKRAWQIYFRQREDKPNNIRSYRLGLNTSPHPVALKGRAWFVADSYQIVGLQTDLIDILPDIRLTVDHTAVEYGPVHFSSRGVDMWLPQTAEEYSDLKGRRIHRRMSFSNYMLFAVDDKQQISSPKTNP